ncbi:hypothetical protein FOZ63_012693 [Perkinsus olseni]|uniref:Peptidase A1 domain-containing protein n=1 Tax=Perkinsus olseni TaxID=32597 RepID=A0A7J6UMH4_PEROL|nr:hypothetical protein FOZ62_023003 [Perkinsus olseni]KAF4758519.1 hypothetical protein FOZ63_012693 [Perkinsus olseni]
MPVNGGFVTVNLDGQRINLLLDSNFFEISVVDGDWYERAYGEGACKKMENSGCYFCPKDDPCDFDNDSSLSTTRFDGGLVIMTISRSGSLELDGQNVDLIFKVSRPVGPNRDAVPKALFGISLLPKGPDQIEGRESVLDSLVRGGVIGRLSYSLRTNISQVSDFASGQLTLGGKADDNYTFLKLVNDQRYHRAFPAVWVSSINLADTGGKPRSAREHEARASFVAFMDTGANGIYVPRPELLNDIKQRLLLRWQGNGVWKRDAKGFLHVKGQSCLDLPQLNLRLSDGIDAVPIRIRPKHYCVTQRIGEDVALVQENSIRILGAPFFKAYSVHVDYVDKKIGLLEN